MRKSDPLYLHEEVLLLALRDKEGTPACISMFEYAMGGAILSELLLRDRVAVDESTKNRLVTVVDTRRIGDPVLDECLKRMASVRRRATMENWVDRFANIKELKERVAKGLCRRDILKADERRVLLLFKRKIYPERDPGPERAIIKRLRRAIFTDSTNIDARTLVLVALANSADLLRMAFDKKELKRRKARLKKLSTLAPAGEATAQAIEAVEAVIAIILIMTIMQIQNN